MQSVIQVCRGRIFSLVTETLTWTKSGPTEHCPAESDKVWWTRTTSGWQTLFTCFSFASTLSFLVPHCFSKQFVQSLQMPVKRSASRRASTTSDDSSSGGNDQFVISPHPRRGKRKASRGGEVSPSHIDEEAAWIVEGHAMAAAREEGQVMSSRKLSARSSPILNTH
jgi:hypothetical protein